MEIDIERTNTGFQFEALKHGQSIDISASALMGEGNSKAFSPMELVLSALGSCLSIDVLNILYKQRQEVDSFRVNVNGTRSAETPAVFTKIEIKLYVRGKIEEERLVKAIRMSEETYCSVHHMLSPKVEILTSYRLYND